MLATNQLSPVLDVLRGQSIQPGETVLACVQTTAHEAIIVTSARIILLKDESRTSTGRAGGRYFPLASIERLEPRRSLLESALVVVTPDTAREPRPFDLSKCSFASCFRNKQLRDQILQIAADEIQRQVQASIQATVNGPLSAITVPSVIPQSGEAFYFAAPAVLYAEHTYRDYVGGSQGVSFRIMRGVYYRVGGYRGQAVKRSQIVEDDRGQIVMSNRRLVFVGVRKTIDVDYSKIIGVTPNGGDAFQINLSNKPALHFVCEDPRASFMLQRLMKNPP